MKTSKDVSARLAQYKKQLIHAGFKRVSAYISLDLVLKLKSSKQQGECLGRTLERLLMGGSRIRPQFHTQEEILDKKNRQHIRTNANTEVPEVIRLKKLRMHNSINKKISS